MAQVIMDHGVSWCFGTRLAPRWSVLSSNSVVVICREGKTENDGPLFTWPLDHRSLSRAVSWKDDPTFPTRIVTPRQ